MKILTINIGSTGTKYALFSDRQEVESMSELKTGLEIDTIAVRTVAPGRFFTEHKILDEEYIEKLKEAEGITPLHIKRTLGEVSKIKEKYGNLFESGKVFAISDSTFHKSIPDYARVYAIPKEMRYKYEIGKQGYHGISLSSIVRKLQSDPNVGSGIIPEKTIVVHMGGGTSVTALKDGLSIDTSMGWTPLDGIPMAERIGSIDPGVLAFIGEKESLHGKSLEEFLSTKCGLEAISGIDHGDIPKILEAEKSSAENLEENKKDAHLAMEVYLYSIIKQIGAMAGVLGGCDLLVLTGTIAENSEEIRNRLLAHLSYRNLVVPTEENLEMAIIAEDI